MKKFRKKPVVISAVQWTGDNHNEIIEFMQGTVPKFSKFDEVLIETLNGTVSATKGEWICRGVQGEYYPCKPDIFDQTYESVSRFRILRILRLLKKILGFPFILGLTMIYYLYLIFKLMVNYFQYGAEAIILWEKDEPERFRRVINEIYEREEGVPYNSDSEL